ncbi:MAG: YihY/virulence factor BrkB family protein [Deltaproteobacteria bacterium]
MISYLKAVYSRLMRGGGRGGKAFTAVRVAAIAVKSFIDDNCALWASTLTFYTLLSIVPLLATIFGIAKGFGLTRLLQAALSTQVEWQRQFVEFLLKFSASALENSRGGLIAGVGVASFFLAIVGLLSSIEQAFNTIWDVRQGRGVARQMADYLSVVFVGTVLLAVSQGATVLITAQLSSAAQRVSFLPPISTTLAWLLQLVPFAANWCLFTFLYLFMPNTKVPFYAGAVAGVAAGILFQAAQWFYITLQIGVADYGAVYGSFAALPLFLIWLQMSWTIALFGGELAFSIANRETYGFFPSFPSTSLCLRKKLALAIAGEITRAFVEGRIPPTADHICSSLRIPRLFFSPLARELMDAGMIEKVVSGSLAVSGYRPALPPSRMTHEAVLAALERRGQTYLPPSTAESIGEKHQKKGEAGDYGT